MIAELGDDRYYDEDKLERDVRKNTLPTAGYEKQVSQGKSNGMRKYTFSLNP